MKLTVILNILIIILGALIALAPWTFAPVCMTEMRCYFTRDVETVLGILVIVLGVIGLMKPE